MRKRYSPQFKAKVVQGILREEKSINKPCRPSEKEVRIKHRIDEVYTQYPFYGSRRIRQHLRREGEAVGKNTIAKYMREMGISAIYPGPNLSKRQKAAYTYPYLLRNITPIMSEVSILPIPVCKKDGCIWSLSSIGILAVCLAGN